MKKITIRDFATSFTTMIFLVIAISGLMMFFHFNNGMVKDLHEMLGVAFVAVAILHVVMNWKSMKNYFSKKIFFSSVIIIGIVSAVFIFQSSNKGADPKGTLIRSVLNAPLYASLEIFKVKKENAIKKLEANGIQIFEEKTIDEIAKSNGVSPFRIISIITTK